MCMGDKCEECGHEGWIKETSPPETEGEAGQDLFAAYRWLKQYGHLPAPGSLIEQANKFVLAVEFCDLVHSVMSARRVQKEEQGAKLKKAIERMGKKGPNGRR